MEKARVEISNALSIQIRDVPSIRNERKPAFDFLIRDSISNNTELALLTTITCEEARYLIKSITEAIKKYDRGEGAG